MKFRYKPAIARLKIRLIQRKEQWTLTVAGWIVTLMSIIVLFTIAIANIYPFLSVNQPIAADVLVVEGWMPDYAIEDAMDEFKTGDYRHLIATGTPLSKGYYLAEYKNFAQLTAATLIALGFNPNQLIVVPTPYVKKDRTYSSAVALREWLSNSDLNIKSLNLFSLGPHTRRSWLIFKGVLAPEYKVGAIAANPQEYNAKTWWQYSEGVRTAIGEAIAFIYARFFSFA
ncbi:ElyC/SanA/YdcF family protein [Limnofasciculus baicalensis]|uniref:YdcF family protein n=1 Tax=Limnofasciculus baicalensis BBK-W-15 TaxID=2699891 RepID=A0AAE3KTF0_9CYAN|nr:ElyC/SanA/YdcF family protein [Limnofasciculus baicalensis]MCP2730457.1 YdcF family protein [Limnofasciculus baicalensis BBK-W-15]